MAAGQLNEDVFSGPESNRTTSSTSHHDAQSNSPPLAEQTTSLPQAVNSACANSSPTK